jgi:transcriptional regulator with XRE-family HTH domain
MSPSSSPSQQRLAAILRRLRDGAGLSTYQLGERLGWSQSRVTRIERGSVSATAADVEAWAQAVNAPASVRDELSELAYEAWSQSRSWRASHRQGIAARQREMARLERDSAGLRQFQPEAIPGLLQSPDYARRVIAMADITGRGDVDEAAAARLERQQILREPGREFRFVLAEGALRWRPGPPEVMAGQRDHLLAAAVLPAVSLAVIPYDREARAPYIHPFTIYDVPGAPLVLTEQYTSETFTSDARDISTYERIFATLAESALTGDEAAGFVRSVLG